MSINQYIDSFKKQINAMSNIQKRVLFFLLLLSIIFGIHSSFSGPRLSNTNVITQPSSQVILSFTSPIQHINSLQVTPEVEFSSSIKNRDIVITFSEPLQYSHSYAIVLNATDNRNKSAIFTKTINLPAPTLYYVERNSDAEGTLYRASLESEQNSEVITLPNLTTFSLGKNTIAVTYEDPLRVGIAENDKVQEIKTPDNYRLNNLQGSTQSDTYLIELINEDNFETSLWFFNEQEKIIKPLFNDAGEQRIGTNVQFAPDGKSFIYINTDGSAIIASIDNSSSDVPVGIVSRILRFLPNLSAIHFARDLTQYYLTTNGTLNEVPEEVRPSNLSSLFQNKNSYAFIGYQFRNETEQQLKIYRAEQSEVLANFKLTERQISSLTLSPNDQFIVTEEANSPIIYDGARIDPKPKNTETVLRDAKSGEIVRTFKGNQLQWQL